MTTVNRCALFASVLALLMLATTLRVSAQNNFGPRGGGQEGSTGATTSSSGAQDPGPRAGAVNAGTPLSSLTPAQLQFFQDGLSRFLQTDSVSGQMAGEPGVGLGPGFNSNSCGGCHAQPAVGGSSPSAQYYPFVGPNPQIAAATDYGGTNSIPYFISAEGPVREARFPFVVSSSGGLTSTPDGGVHDVFTIAGRQDAEGCVMPQPNFQEMNKLGNIIFRIPTPVFGAGFIENIPDATILANMAANSSLKRQLGITGHPNYSGNDGTITRFGWKAQNKSLRDFLRRGLQRRNGRHQRELPRRTQQSALRLPLQSHSRGRNQLHALRRSDSERSGRVLQLHALPHPSCSFDHGNSRQSLGTIHCRRPGDLHSDRLRRLPHSDAADRSFELHAGASQPAGSAVLRFARPQHGLWSGR